MKKSLLLLASLMPALYANAQITITQNDFPVVGTFWSELHDNRLNMHTITPAGPNQTWNYANAFVVSDTSALSYIAPSSTPPGWAANFPNANLATYSPIDSAAQFYQKNANGFYFDGFYDNTAGLPTTVFDFVPDQLLVPTPFTYNNTRNNLSVITIDFPAAPPVPGSRFKLYTISEFMADAWGSLATPAGNYPATLRIKSSSYTVDSTFVDLLGNGNYTFLQSGGNSDTAISYTWFRNGSNALVMSIDVDGATMESTGANYYVVGPLSVPQVNPGPSVKIYPNPAAEFVSFELNIGKWVELHIFDASGRLVRKENISGIDRLRLGISAFDKGMYHYELRGDEAGEIRIGKFIVVR